MGYNLCPFRGQLTMMDADRYFDWQAALRQHRERRGLSRPALARLANLSASAIKGVETGSRHPSPDALSRIIDALGLTRDEASPIRAGAGYAVDWQGLFHQRFLADKEWLDKEIERCPWPAFITGQGINLVAANRAFQRVWDVDLSTEFTDPDQRNLLGGASFERFARYAENYDELLRFMIGLAKGDPRMRQDLENPAPWLKEPARRFLQGDPKYIKRFIEAWEKAEPIPHRTRFHHEVRWLYRGEQPMRFFGITTIADIWNELSWNDWIPADAETWQALKQIMSPP